MNGEVVARKLLQHLEERGIVYPTPMVKVCAVLRIPVCFAPLEPFDGCYMRNRANKRLLILINNKTAPRRQHFSIAHELGHIALNHPPVEFLDSTLMTPCAPWHEVEANYFASELLMPKLVLAPMGPMTPQEIARYCHVSLGAAKVRAKQLGWG